MAYQKNILVEGLLPGKECYNLVINKHIPVSRLKELIFTQKSIPPDAYYLTANGICLKDYDGIRTCEHNCFTVLQAHLILPGGKGGFGTLIRAMGTQINKGSHKGACRDLSGRRMRDVDTEKKLAKWMTEEPERKKKCREAKIKKLEQRRSEPKHYFNDTTYMDQIHSSEQEVDSALQQGMHAAAMAVDTKGKKRQSVETYSSKCVKKQKIWVGVDSSDELSDSDFETESVSEKLGNNNSCPKSVVGESSESVSNANLDERLESTNTETDDSSVLETEVGNCCRSKEDTNPAKPEILNSENDRKLKMINIEDYGSVEEVMEVGGDLLKFSLQSMGLKCGGTVRERAQRLFSTKGKSEEEIDPSLYAKKKKKH